MTFITWVAYVQKTYTKQVWSIVYLLLGFVRTSYTINEWLHTFFLSNPVIKGVEWAQSETLGDCVKILIFAS